MVISSIGYHKGYLEICTVDAKSKVVTQLAQIYKKNYTERKRVE